MQPLLECGQLLDGLHPAGLQLVALPDQPLPFVVCGAGVLAEPAELLVDRRDRGVGLVERGQRLLGGVLAGLLLGQRAGQRRGQLADLLLRGRQLAAGLLDLRGDLQGAGLAVRAAAEPACADEIAVGGDRTQLRTRRHQIQRRGQVADHRDAGQHCAHRATQPRRHVDQVGRPQRAFGRRPGLCRRLDRPVAQHDRRAATVGLLERGDGRAGGTEALRGDGVGCRAQHRRDAAS